ncbi:DUF900 hydrolase-like protein [Fadolivirus algeromassiliense]|jgi:hypothetical protein|uniref:DUF900 hydrolase-like protein n=1 Tax=Fadolivirus FV1/VV64 TaxID=3070911 RepID=A0A7D3QXY6_9VIRU|nr:DUF900 hydrolase-like protein [Fadolivirus algeromassiliense]QKF94820.1 DUF900 hydrolase-like protein [Fadolivirus FV1/VV64]
MHIVSRFYSSASKLTPVVKQSIKKPEITLYIKGFLSKAEKTDNSDRWLASHHKLIFKHKWHHHATHHEWDCGSLKVPPPFASGMNALYHIYNSSKIIRTNPITFASSLAIDTTLLAGMIMYQYFIVEENTHIMAPKLALELIELSKKHSKVRVVCHSLGCKLLLNAIEYIPDKHKPTSVHLCAPTFNETEYQHILDNISKNKTYIYYTPKDSILSVALQLTKNKDPVGAYGLKNTYQNVRAVDVTNYFNNHWLVHNNYHKVFHKFIHDDSHGHHLLESRKKKV